MDLDDLDDESQAHADHLKDPHKQLVQLVLRQIYSPWAAVEAGRFHEPRGPSPDLSPCFFEVPARNGWLKLFKSLLQLPHSGLFWGCLEVDGDGTEVGCQHQSHLFRSLLRV